MSVNNIINMAILKGLDIIALTDHNSCKNCPAFLNAAKNAGIRALPGMEINTSEEVHAVCLFKDLSHAMAFDKYVFDSLPNIQNRPEIFGEQLLIDEDDKITGHIDKLLIAASSISFFQLRDIMNEFHGVYFPSHIDRESFSIISNLGFIPDECSMDAFELTDITRLSRLKAQNPVLATLPLLRNSDAHYLWDISEAENLLPESFAKLINDK